MVMHCEQRSIIKGAITQLASAGYITLQVPDSAYGDVELENIPAHWVWEIKNQRPALGKERGHLHLTRAGWEANKVAIKAAFESSQFPRDTWEEFERFVENEFATWRRKLLTEYDRLQRLSREAGDKVARL